MATFIGQVSVLSLIALFGAATTALVSLYSCLLHMWTEYAFSKSKNVLCVDNNGEERSYVVAVVFDIHQAVDWAARVRIAVDSNGNSVEDGSYG